MPADPRPCEVSYTHHDYHKNCVPTVAEIKNVRKERQKNIKSALDGKETVRYFTTEGIKVMLIPSKEPNKYPITVKTEEFEALKAKAVVVTEKERLKMLEDARIEQARLQHECDIRKNDIKQFDKRAATPISPPTGDVTDKAGNYMLKRAWELKNEQEDEVKKANSLILQVKCQAIRDAQLLERKLIQKEWRKEEIRIERMLEDARARDYQEEKNKMDNEKAKKESYVKALTEQIAEIEARRLLDAELLIEERRKTNEAMFVIMLEELENVKKREEEKMKTRDFLFQANEDIKKAQAMEREEQRLYDLRVATYLKMKAEREEKFERMKEEERKRNELKFNRQKGLRETAADLHALQEQMSVVRRQEQYEREWRKREKEAALKKQKQEEECKIAREQQIKDIRIFQALEIGREKREFEKNLQLQIAVQEKERLLEVKRQHEIEVYREQLLKQINEKEKERIAERQEKFREGLAIKAIEAKKKHDLRMMLEKKIENLRTHKIPEIYIADIQRQLNLTPRQPKEPVQKRTTVASEKDPQISFSLTERENGDGGRRRSTNPNKSFSSASKVQPKELNSLPFFTPGVESDSSRLASSKLLSKTGW